LNDVLVGMLTSAAIVRHHRIAAETAKRQRQEAHEAYLREQERLRYEARVDTFIESKADELAKLQKILSFRDYISKQQTDAIPTDAIKHHHRLRRQGCCAVSIGKFSRRRVRPHCGHGSDGARYAPMKSRCGVAVALCPAERSCPRLRHCCAFGNTPALKLILSRVARAINVPAKDSVMRRSKASRGDRCD
jgi:hypothetical protein